MVKKLYILLLGFLLGSCEDPILIQFLNQDLIFPRAIKIDVEPYQYNNNNDTIMVFGDSLFTNDTICDTLSPEPYFEWEPTNAPFVVAAIFDNSPVISENDKDLLNPEDIIWIWHSGLESDGATSQEGKVFYKDGKYRTNDDTEFFIENYQSIPKPLGTNSVYYWGVWGWNSEGQEVNYSSYPLKFFVK